MITFIEWLKLREVGTGTNAIASFARPIFSEPVRRTWAVEDPFFKKKRLSKTNRNDNMMPDK